MTNKLYALAIAGCTIPTKFIYEETALQFGSYCTEVTDQLDDTPVILLSGKELDEVSYMYPPHVIGSLLEFNELVPRVSEHLLKFNRCLFHGMTFLMDGKAWILTGYSGVGKTTQYVRWKNCYADEISILNGDKPILEIREDGKIWVHSSPWRGKENMGREGSAPLGGIICLRQGPLNHIERLEAKDAVVPIFSQFIYLGETEEAIRQVCRMEERILQEIAVWRLTNLGDEASARMSYETIKEFEEESREVL